MKSRDRKSFTTCIAAVGHARRWEEAVELFEEMQGKMKADLMSMSALIHACGHGAQWQRAVKLLGDLKVYDIPPSVVTYGAALAACERGQEWSQALALLSQMQQTKCFPNAIAISAALVCCQKSLQWQRAALLMEHFGLWEATDTKGGWKATVAKIRLVNDTASMQALSSAHEWPRAVRVFQELRRAVRRLEGLAFRALRPDADACFEAVKASSLCANWAMALAVTDGMLRSEVPVRAVGGPRP